MEGFCPKPLVFRGPRHDRQQMRSQTPKEQARGSVLLLAPPLEALAQAPRLQRPPS